MSLSNPSLPPATAPPGRGSVLVTGAAKRLGRAIALRLAEDGYRVIVHYFAGAEDAAETVAMIENSGGSATSLQADLADPSAVAELCDWIERECDPAQCTRSVAPLQFLVNSASYFVNDRPDAPDPTLFAHANAVNVVAPTQLTAALVRGLRAVGGAGGKAATGAVVNLLDNKLGALNPDFFSYTLSKAALGAATHMSAMAFAPDVRVNGVAPGITLISGKQTQESFERAFRLTPLGRSSRPKDICAAVAFLLDAPSVTGQVFVVDGGGQLLALPRDVAFLPGIGDLTGGSPPSTPST